MIEALRALEKAVELVAKATPGPWEQGGGKNGGKDTTVYCDDSLGSAVATCGHDFTALVSRESELANAEAIAAAVNFVREHGAAILSARQEVAPVAKRVETGVVQFGDDWPGIFIRGDNAFGLAMTLTCDEGPLRNAAIKSVVDLLSSCNVANNPKVRVIPSPAHTSEARDAVDVADVRIVIDFIFRHFGQHWNVGPALTGDVVAAVRRVEAAMRQEAE